MTISPFKLVCDDFRPGNILIDKDLKITAVCDWEWTYAAPFQQFYAPPRWLLLKAPEEWHVDEHYGGGTGEDDMLKAFTQKLDLFIRVLEEEEVKRAAEKPDNNLHVNRPRRLSLLEHTEHSPGDGYNGILGDESLTNEEAITALLSEKPATPTHTPAEESNTVYLRTGSSDSLSDHMHRSFSAEHLEHYNNTDNGVESLSSLMRSSFTNGRFWFNECLRAYNFHLMYWLRFHKYTKHAGLSADEIIQTWSEADKQELEAFMVKKTKDLEDYNTELQAMTIAAQKGNDTDKENVKLTMGDGQPNEKDVAGAAAEKGKLVLEAAQDGPGV